MSAITRLKAAWDLVYHDDKKFKKVVNDLWSDDYFSTGSGNYVDDRMGETYSEEEIAEMSPKEKGEAEYDIVEDWVRDRWSDFESDFERVATEKDGMLEANRCIGVEDAEEFLFFVANETPLPEYTGLGVYWSWNKEDAECHWGKGAEHVYVHALIPFESIDPYVMLTQNLRPSTGEDESEIYVKEGAKVLVTEVEMLTDKQMAHDKVQPPQPIPMTAESFYVKYPTLAKVLLEVSASVL